MDQKRKIVRCCTCCRQRQHGIGVIIQEITLNLRCATGDTPSDRRDWTFFLSPQGSASQPCSSTVSWLLISRWVFNMEFLSCLSRPKIWVATLLHDLAGFGKLCQGFCVGMTFFGAPHILANSELLNFFDCWLSKQTVHRGCTCQQGGAVSWRVAFTWNRGPSRALAWPSPCSFFEATKTNPCCLHNVHHGGACTLMRCC